MTCVIDCARYWNCKKVPQFQNADFSKFIKKWKQFSLNSSKNERNIRRILPIYRKIACTKFHAISDISSYLKTFQDYFFKGILGISEKVQPLYIFIFLAIGASSQRLKFLACPRKKRERLFLNNISRLVYFYKY